MTAQTTLEGLRDARIIPVVVIDDAERARDLVDALVDGGIGCAEFTLRTPAGLTALRNAARPGFLAGAGTVISPEQVEQCADAGASFIVSPGFDPEVVERALALGMAVLPGIATATELQCATRAGLDVVKFFPADRLGGLGTIEALAAPFPGSSFVPSGGVNAANARAYLAHPAIWAVSGSWMVRRDWLASADFPAVREASARAVQSIAEAS